MKKLNLTVVCSIDFVSLIISRFYDIPSIIYVGLGVIFFVVVGFILLGLYLMREV